MSGRGSTVARPRGRPSKVTKPPIAGGRGGRGGRPSSLTADHLETQLARGDDEHQAGRQDPDHIPGEEEEVDDQDPNNHHPHTHQAQFEMSASAAAHGLLSNGPGQPGPGPQQTADPDIHPDLQNLVPHPGPEQHQHQHQAQQGFAMEAPMDAGAPRTALNMSQESGYPDLLIDSALAKRLCDIEGSRLAVQRRQDQVLNLKRRSNVEALLAHVSGQEAHSPCKSCHKGYGPWNGCIVVNGQMCGSCANCWFNASGSRCSFHETNLPQAQQHIPAIQLQQPAPQANAFAIPPGLPVQPQQLQTQQLAPHAQNAFAAGGLDQFVRAILSRVMVDARTDDPHMRFQFRIETAARQLALATAEYGDFLAQEQEQQDHQQQQAAVAAAAQQQQQQHHHHQQQQHPQQPQPQPQQQQQVAAPAPHGPPQQTGAPRGSGGPEAPMREDDEGGEQ